MIWDDNNIKNILAGATNEVVIKDITYFLYYYTFCKVFKKVCVYDIR